MKSKLGILSALVLSAAVAGSAFAATGTKIVKKNASATKPAAHQTTKTAAKKKSRKMKKTTKKMKTAPATMTPKK